MLCLTCLLALWAHCPPSSYTSDISDPPLYHLPFFSLWDNLAGQSLALSVHLIVLPSIYVSSSVHSSLCLSLHLIAHLSNSCLYILPSIHLFLHLFVLPSSHGCISICPLTCLSLHLIVLLSVYPSVYPSIPGPSTSHLSVYPFIHLSVHLIYPPIFVYPTTPLSIHPSITVWATRLCWASQRCLLWKS